MEPSESSDVDELDTVKNIRDLLKQLRADARVRVLEYIFSLHKAELGHTRVFQPSGDTQTLPSNHFLSEENTDTFAEFIEQVDPQSNVDSALATGYWLQVVGKQENFTALEVNRLLLDLGRKINNITNALGSLQKNKPAHVIQIKKKGSSRQARKVYKLTTAGISAVNNMTRQETES